ncbi:Lead, cadmium, zinc and mercury transporting ATPase; Copper-translocating P-type ATPase [hydrothermal vent metagenome]|uniref:Lead, cadmium, zinc and mercury transporting ATPase Copper-translocating P-type ATPase n=1 Tax=hydrothermal vent metagenome TaxID=652676 RepID=A0A3B0R7I0_9ZZZZ
MKKTTLYVKEMDCADEVRLIKAAFKGLDGIESYDTNLISRSLEITYDPELLSVKDIIKVIAKIGMKASLKKEDESNLERAWWKEPRILTLSICGLLILSSLVLEHVIGLSHGTVTYVYGAAVLVGGYYPAKMGIAALKTLTPNIRTLMVVGAVGAIALGFWEEAALLVLIYSLGDVLEAYAADRVRGAVRALMGLASKEALIKKDGNEITLPLEEVRVGDIIIIRPGEKLPLDGEVVFGASSVDQAPITGESIPVSKEIGDEVLAGSINQRGSMEVRVTKPFHDTTLGKIIHYVENTEARKSSYQRFGDTFGKYYTPLMFFLALAVMIVPSLFYGNWSDWFYRGLVVLVVSCSCGIALSIPVAVVASISNASKQGVLVKGGAYIEAAAGIKAVAFDKTGSLTMGRPVVTDVVPFNESTEDEVLAVAASIESRSEHVLANAILNRAKEKGLTLRKVSEFEAVPGLGARAVISGSLYSIGNKDLCGAEAFSPEAKDRIERLEDEGKTLILLTTGSVLTGVIAVRDEVRPEAKETLLRLKELGVSGLIMLTGDNERVAKIISEHVGTDEYMAGLLPQDKAQAIEGLRGRYGQVAMVGDGVNDAPAMVTSDLGIAMGAAGTDVAIETGDIVLMSDDLSKIPYVIGLSRRTVRIMRENLIISLTIIGFLVPLALTGWIGLVPGLLINEVGGLLVIINALRLLKYNKR